jgi:hypothetical protein
MSDITCRSKKIEFRKKIELRGIIHLKFIPWVYLYVPFNKEAHEHNKQQLQRRHQLDIKRQYDKLFRLVVSEQDKINQRKKLKINKQQQLIQFQKFINNNRNCNNKKNNNNINNNNFEDINISTNNENILYNNSLANSRQPAAAQPGMFTYIFYSKKQQKKKN